MCPETPGFSRDDRPTKSKGASAPEAPSNPLQRPRIHPPAKILLNRPSKLRPIPRLRKQRHRRTKLQIIRKPKNLRRRLPLHPIHDRSAFPQPPTQHRMPQISPRLFQRPNRKPLRHRTSAKPSNLRKNKPHPMTPLLPRPQLLTNLLIHPILRLFETPQVVSIIPATHFELRIRASFQFDARSNPMAATPTSSASQTGPAQIPKTVLDKYVTLW